MMLWFSCTFVKKYPKGESFFVVPAGNKRIWFISKDYKERFLRPVKILYFCLAWVEILMTPLSSKAYINSWVRDPRNIPMIEAYTRKSRILTSNNLWLMSWFRLFDNSLGALGIWKIKTRWYGIKDPEILYLVTCLRYLCKFQSTYR